MSLECAPPKDDFARFFDHALDLHGSADVKGYFRRVNQAWQRTLGWSAEELTGTPWLDFIHPDDRALTLEAGNRLCAGLSVVSFENRYRCKDASTAPRGADRNSSAAALRSGEER